MRKFLVILTPPHEAITGKPQTPVSSTALSWGWGCSACLEHQAGIINGSLQQEFTSSSTLSCQSGRLRDNMCTGDLMCCSTRHVWSKEKNPRPPPGSSQTHVPWLLPHLNSSQSSQCIRVNQVPWSHRQRHSQRRWRLTLYEV